ncbi:hypothetical protein PUN28_017515 [Cardiocondyla obscurior]
MSIPEFYAGQSIFLTGATGFLGKVLIEKVLRSCPDVGEIFLLIRPKKGMSIDDRLKNMLKLPLFDKLREEQCSVFSKLIPISGDSKKKSLGLSDADVQMLIDRVTIIIHGAASVRFNDSLKNAICTNIRATRDICILAQSMKKLITLLYISTAYTSPHRPVLEEKVYPPIADWRKMIDIAESLDEHTLNILTAKCLEYAPNTYMFSKNLSEHVIETYSSFLPCAIVRPSMVFPSIEEPFPGWVDNIYGTIGFYVGSGKGVLRVALNNYNVYLDIVPVDIVIKAILVTCWKVGSTTHTPGSNFVVNNTCQNLFTYEYIGIMLGIEIKEIPFENSIFPSRVVQTNNWILYYTLMILLHMLPALIVDTILKRSGRQPFLVRLQRNVFVATQAVGWFACNEWKFTDTNHLALLSSIPPNDRANFSFNYVGYDSKEYFRYCVIGAKKFLINEDMNKIDGLKVNVKRMDFIFDVMKHIVAVSVLWMTFKWFKWFIYYML